MMHQLQIRRMHGSITYNPVQSYWSFIEAWAASESVLDHSHWVHSLWVFKDKRNLSLNHIYFSRMFWIGAATGSVLWIKCPWNFRKFYSVQLLFKKRPQHRRFPVKFAKFLRAPILKKICERLLQCKRLLLSGGVLQGVVTFNDPRN